MAAMTVQEIIAAKRDGQENSPEQLEFISRGASDGSIPDYQLSAWLMAVYLNGMTPKETADLTLAMAASGDRLDLTGIPKPWVDKHSTGGVGDKTTLVLLPLLCACGLTMVKMSGRGLGITGGTIDKLESIPGFRTDLSPEEMIAQAKLVGIALTGQTPKLAPADKVFYALRDVTSTVSSLPLIVSSILSKKIAGGAETVVLDVKCGSGAFMKTIEEARSLRDSLVSVGELAGLKVAAEITDMNQPLGRAVGNALEVKEAIRVLRGEEQGRFRELCLEMAGHTLEMVGESEGRSKAEKTLDSGFALQSAMHWFHAQKGGVAVFDDEDWQTAPVVTEILAKTDGWVSGIDAGQVGAYVVDLGGGRRKKTDEIDHTVGIELAVEVGSKVEKGSLLAKVHSREAIDIAQAEGLFKIVDVATSPWLLILD